MRDDDRGVAGRGPDVQDSDFAPGYPDAYLSKAPGYWKANAYLSGTPGHTDAYLSKAPGYWIG